MIKKKKIKNQTGEGTFKTIQIQKAEPASAKTLCRIYEKNRAKIAAYVQQQQQRGMRKTSRLHKSSPLTGQLLSNKPGQQLTTHIYNL